MAQQLNLKNRYKRYLDTQNDARIPKRTRTRYRDVLRCEVSLFCKQYFNIIPRNNIVKKYYELKKNKNTK